MSPDTGNVPEPQGFGDVIRDEPTRWRVMAIAERMVAEAEKRGAVKALARVSEEIDEDKRYPGFDLVMWLTGLQNGIASGEVTL